MLRTIIYFFLFSVGSYLFAQAEYVVELKPIHRDEVRFAGFRLNSDKTIHIEAEGAGEKTSHRNDRINWIDPNDMFAYAWILNAQSREMVWRMSLENTERKRGTRFNRKFEGDIQLPRGEYEVYFSSYIPRYGFNGEGFFSLGRLLSKLLRGEEWYDEDEERWFIRVSDVDEAASHTSVEKFHKARRQQAIISITGLSDSDFRQEGFKLTQPGRFLIYAIGEGYRGESFDYGWLVDANTSQKIWESLPENGEYAGGARKNQLWKREIELQPGDYWVYFVMDDSHSPGNWNSNPPYDPDFYGITITSVKGEFDPNSVEKLLKQKVKPIVALTRVREDEFVQKGFTLSEPIKVRVYALGEGRGGEMFDYGWIEDMDSGEIVWQMEYRHTRHAGGASKNRLVDEVILLPKGSYMVYYRTDGSHSYRDWNATPPYNPKSWGITVYPADPRYNEEKIQALVKPKTSQKIIAQIIRVGDDRHKQKRFILERKTRIRVYAIGEGDWDEMYDYGWIEDDETGKTVWKMTYDKTEWAGGARKNRKVNEEITLPAGGYLLRFKTDGTHSFEEWNDDAPNDPFHYGITLYRIGE